LPLMSRPNASWKSCSAALTLRWNRMWLPSIDTGLPHTDCSAGQLVSCQTRSHLFQPRKAEKAEDRLCHTCMDKVSVRARHGTGFVAAVCLYLRNKRQSDAYFARPR
jgi:hypothetical protein